MPTPPHLNAPATPEALGVLELTSIVRGHRVLDAMVKRAPVRVRDTYPVSGGKLLIFIDGSVAEVEEAMDAGREAMGPWCYGDLFLPRAHDALWRGLEQRFDPRPVDALGLLESHSVADILRATDAALKAAEVSLATLHLARGIGGRAYMAITGAQHDVEAGLDAADAHVRPDLRIERELLCRPHDDMTLALLNLETLHIKY